MIRLIGCLGRGCAVLDEIGRDDVRWQGPGIRNTELETTKDAKHATGPEPRSESDVRREIAEVRTPEAGTGTGSACAGRKWGQSHGVLEPALSESCRRTRFLDSSDSLEMTDGTASRRGPTQRGTTPFSAGQLPGRAGDGETRLVRKGPRRMALPFSRNCSRRG